MDDPINDILEAGAMLNWIGAIAAWLQDLANGPHHTFLIPSDCRRSPREIARLLRRHGIKTWGEMIVNKELLITVRRGQASFGQWLLDREGIPTINQAPGRKGSRKQATRRAAGRAEQKRPGLLAAIDRFLDS